MFCLFTTMSMDWIRPTSEEILLCIRKLARNQTDGRKSYFANSTEEILRFNIENNRQISQLQRGLSLKSISW